jgi:hypothetical protein
MLMVRPPAILIFMRMARNIATCMYYTWIDPFTKQEVYVAKGLRDRKMPRPTRPSEAMSQTAQTRIEDLRLALHGVTSPFSCEGTFVSDKPVKLVFKDKTRLEVIRTKDSFDQ